MQLLVYFLIILTCANSGVKMFYKTVHRYQISKDTPTMEPTLGPWVGSLKDKVGSFEIFLMCVDREVLLKGKAQYS
jgi:hypothetical protein